MDEIWFEGIVATGIGKHSQLVVPGRAKLRGGPPDWPDELHPGSLNVRVDGYPSAFKDHGLANHVEELDKGLFAPAFEIGRDQFGGRNTLSPRPGLPRGGDAQVWRARLVATHEDLTVECWALRRFGSRVGEQLEFVSSTRLRSVGLTDGQCVRVSLSGSWRLAGS